MHQDSTKVNGTFIHRIWGTFVDCIRYYTTDCATADQRRRFNNAVGDSMDTVRAVCSSEKYQKGRT